MAQIRIFSTDRWLLMAALVFGFLSGLPAARADVRDEGHFFDRATVEQVEAASRQMKQNYGKELVVRTYTALPPARAAKLETDGKAVVFHDWAIDEARAAKADGVLILICNSPAHLEVATGNKTRLRTFTKKDQDALRDLLITKFRQKQFDDGLQQGAKMVLERMERNTGGSGPTTRPQSGPATEPDDDPSTSF